MSDGGARGPWTVPGPALRWEQICALSEGTEVEIVWSGGNGPGRYRVVFNMFEHPYVVPDFEYPKGPSSRLWFYNPLVDWSIGERPLTEVRLVEGA